MELWICVSEFAGLFCGRAERRWETTFSRAVRLHQACKVERKSGQHSDILTITRYSRRRSIRTGSRPGPRKPSPPSGVQSGRCRDDPSVWREKEVVAVLRLGGGVRAHPAARRTGSPRSRSHFWAVRPSTPRWRAFSFHEESGFEETSSLHFCSFSGSRGANR